MPKVRGLGHLSTKLSRAVCRHCLPFFLILSVVEAIGFGSQEARAKEPAASRGTIDVQQLGKIDEAVNAAIKRGELPGAVVLVVHHGETVYCKTFGNRGVKPSEAP